MFSLVILGGLFVAASAVSRLGFHRSLAASLVELGIKIANNGELASPEAAKLAMKMRALVEDDPFDFHPEKYKSAARIQTFEGVEVITFGEKVDSANIVLFLHGGAYVNEITGFHLDFCDRMARETGAYIVVPLYPLAPNHTYRETYAFLEKLYPQLLSESESLTIMGDSAGGGLAIAWCEDLAIKKGQMPEHVIAFSPWLDVSMTASDYSSYEPVDPMLGLPGTVDMGKAWAGELDTKNYLVSPYYGNPAGLPEITMFVGTRELMYPDVVSFHEKLKEAGVDAVLHVGEGMNHIYPIYPVVPESVAAAQEAFRIVRGEGRQKEA